MDSSRVLVTGGAGFVGSHIVDLLVEKGYDVTVVDSFTKQVHDGYPDYLNDGANYIQADLRNRQLMAKLLEWADIVNHQASAVGVAQSMYEIERYVDINSLGTATILDIIVDNDIDIEKFVIASSMSIYGEGKYRCQVCERDRYPSVRSVDSLSANDWEHRCETCGATLKPQETPEDSPKDCTSVYAVTKRDQEELVLAVCRSRDIPAVALRYFNIYGERQSLSNPYTGVCAIFSSRIKNDNRPLLYEDGHQTRDFIHVSDVARANLSAMRENVEDEALNIGTGEPQTIEHVADRLIELFGKESTLEPEIANDFRKGDIRHCFGDIDHATSVLDWEPQVAFDQGLKELVSWSRDREAEDEFDDAHAELEEHDLLG